MGLRDIICGCKKEDIPEDKKRLLYQGKELGINLDPSMSLYEMEHRIAEAKQGKKEEPKKQPSKKKGEY